MHDVDNDQIDEGDNEEEEDTSEPMDWTYITSSGAGESGLAIDLTNSTMNQVSVSTPPQEQPPEENLLPEPSLDQPNEQTQDSAQPIDSMQRAQSAPPTGDKPKLTMLEYLLPLITPKDGVRSQLQPPPTSKPSGDLDYRREASAPPIFPQRESYDHVTEPVQHSTDQEEQQYPEVTDPNDQNVTDQEPVIPLLQEDEDITDAPPVQPGESSDTQVGPYRLRSQTVSDDELLQAHEQLVRRYPTIKSLEQEIDDLGFLPDFPNQTDSQKHDRESSNETDQPPRKLRVVPPPKPKSHTAYFSHTNKKWVTFKENFKAHHNVYHHDDPINVPAGPAQILDVPDSQGWVKCTLAELDALRKLKVIEFIYDKEIPAKGQLIKSRFMYARKTDASGQEVKKKARLIACGYNHRPDGSSWSPTIRTASLYLMSVEASRLGLDYVDYDCKSAYLNASIGDSLVYLTLPDLPESIKTQYFGEATYIRLRKSIYGLRDSGRKWWLLFRSRIEKLGFTSCLNDPAAYMRLSWYQDENGNEIPSLDLIAGHVDDFRVFSKDPGRIGKEMEGSFGFSPSGQDEYLGLECTTTHNVHGYTEYVFSLSKYIEQSLKDVDMKSTRYVSLPWNNDILKQVDSPQLSPKMQAEFWQYVGIIGWVSGHIRPDLSFAYSVLSSRAGRASVYDMEKCKTVLRYMHHTKDKALHISYDPTYDKKHAITAFSDASFNIPPRTGIAILAYGSLVYWRCETQTSVTDASSGSEYVAASDAALEGRHLREFLVEMYTVANPKKYVPKWLQTVKLYVDNSSVLDWVEGNRLKRARRISMKKHVIRTMYRQREIIVLHLPSQLQPADLLTKPVNMETLKRFLTHLKVY